MHGRMRGYMKQTDVLVIGGGPAGLAAAIAASKEGAETLLIEREERLGGILKQCIHDGFGLVRYGEKLSGPEYAERFIEEFLERGIVCRTQAFVTNITKREDGFLVTVTDKNGMTDYETHSVILATGCRERTAKQVSIHGTRPSGVFTAGTAQHFVNLMGERITKNCVILGSGDIGLIMARRLTLEGARVLGVYEAKPEPSGLTRNIMQCLEDYDIPLYLSHTVTRVYGEERVEGVEISRVDDWMRPIAGTEKRVDCDALILSVGLLPENEIAAQLGVEIDSATKGPACGTDFMTSVEGVFSCGNALHVNDLVDYVSESGELAGRNAAWYCAVQQGRPGTVSMKADNAFQYVVPQKLALGVGEDAILYFRSRASMPKAVFQIEVDGQVLFEKRYTLLKPPEMKRLAVNFEEFPIRPGSEIVFHLRGGVS